MTILLLGIIYISFISLGLPDSLLGAAWPTMCLDFSVPVSWAGPISLTISAGTIVSSLFSDRLTRKLGTGLVTAVSVSMTALALLGFSFTENYWLMFLWAIPCGLGAGGITAGAGVQVAEEAEELADIVGGIAVHFHGSISPAVVFLYDGQGGLIQQGAPLLFAYGGPERDVNIGIRPPKQVGILLIELRDGGLGEKAGQTAGGCPTGAEVKVHLRSLPSHQSSVPG